MIQEIIGDLSQDEICGEPQTDIKYRNVGGFLCEDNIHNLLSSFDGRCHSEVGA